MREFNVTGMSCSACSARVEKVVSEVPGVKECSVSLLTNSMSIEGDAEDSAIISAVEAAGYHAKSYESGNHILEKESEDDSSEHETSILKKRLVSSVIFLMILMYFSMGYMMFGFPLPEWFQGNPIAIGLIQMLLAGIIMVINQKFFISGFRSMRMKAPNMDTLVALGSFSAFSYSFVVLLLMTKAQVAGDSSRVCSLSMEMYFESAGMILALITIGKLLESKSKGKTTDAIKSLMKLAPQTATLITEGKQVKVSIEQVKKDDIFCVYPGEAIPVDGIIIKGSSAVNEAALTGESIPVDKKQGDNVSAATINQSGYMECQALRVGEDTTISQIVKMVRETSSMKAPIAAIADKVSGIFVPTVITLSVITLIIWIAAGESFGFALARAISVLVISCPCALGLATPVAIMVGNGMGAKNGILFKTATSLEETGKASVVVFDKTGTITEGTPIVTDIITTNNNDESLFLSFAGSLEEKSEHPLAKAVQKMRKEKGLPLQEITDFEVKPGNGIIGKLQGDEVYGGNLSFIQEKVFIPESFIQQGEQLAQHGKTPLYFGRKKTFEGLIAVADTIKEDSKEAVKELKDMGLKVILLTGDHEKTASVIGKEAGIDDIISEVMPAEKENVIKKICKQEKVIMVGDGINDAPALTRADIGIAIGNGTDVAIDAADVVLMKGNIRDVCAAIRLSRQTLKNIKENLFWAFVYNIIGIPLAMGVFIPLFGWKLNPMFGAAAMSLSSFCVVTNALKLNRFSMYNRKSESQKKETKKMVRKMMIEGMMCAHCEARVKKVLEDMPQVEKADVDHEKNSATVYLKEETTDDSLKNVVEEQGYQVIAIEKA